MLNDEQAAVFARLIAECAGAAYGNHGVDTTDAYRVLMAYIGDLLAAERVAVMQNWADYLDGLRAGAEILPIRKSAAP